MARKTTHKLKTLSIILQVSLLREWSETWKVFTGFSGQDSFLWGCSQRDLACYIVEKDKQLRRAP
jgi:hypothetical protein